MVRPAPWWQVMAAGRITSASIMCSSSSSSRAAGTTFQSAKIMKGDVPLRVISAACRKVLV